MRTLRHSGWPRLLGTPALVLFLGAISCGGSSDEPPPPEAIASHRVAIRAYAGPDKKRIDIVPRSSREAEADSPSQSPSMGVKRLQTKTVSGAGPENTPVVFGEEFLLYSAAMECAKAPYISDATQDVWASGRWFYLPTAATSCDQQLAYEENMLCAAQKLADLADAVAPVTWSKAPNGPYTFPSQATADRVVVRDLALEVLANLAVTDMRALSTGRYYAACAEQYSRVASGVVQAELDPEPSGSYVKMTELDTIFDTVAQSSHFEGDGGLAFRTLVDPSALPKRLKNAPAIAKSRLLFEAHVLRAASRLGERLIRESVRDDLAGAEKRRSEALDPLLGAKAAWGLTGSADEDGYNTLNHATRVLFGRLDESRFPSTAALGTAGSSSCATEPSTGAAITRNTLIAKAYGADLSARTGDSPARTAVQRAAVRLVESAGIVIPSVAVSGDLTQVRTAMRKQLLASKAEDLGTSAALLELDPRGQALLTTLAATADEDLRFALNRTYALFRMLASFPESGAPLPTGDIAGLKRRTTVVGEISALGGTAFRALPRVDLAHDFMARAGTMQDVGQCPAEYQLNLARAYRLPFQSAPAMLQTLYHRFGDLRRFAAAAKMDEATQLADVARVELREAAGPGLIISKFDPDNIMVMTIGLEKPGTDSLSTAVLKDSLVLAYGEPWLADCVAGLRESCPADMSAYLGKTAVIGRYDIAAPGSDRPVFFRNFARSELGSAFSLAASNAETAKHIYVVIPGKAGAPGKVLGVIPFKTQYSESYTVVSDLQRELLNDVMGFPTGSAAACGSRLSEEADSSKSAAYCVEGIARNTFVPLANELTSDASGSETSWRHYLTLAKQAAARADELGQKLIDIGLQQDFRREGAGEAVGAICGDYAALDKIKYEDGAISSKTDSTIAACLDEPRLPIVFFSTSKTKAEAQTILGCSGTSPPSNCGVLPDVVPGIDIVADSGDGAAESTDPASRCSGIVAAARSISGGFDSGAVGAALVSSWASRDSLHAAASMITVHVDEGLEWTVDAIGKKIMSSDPSSGLWPGCLRSGTGLGGTTACQGGASSSAGSAEYKEFAKRLSKIFLRRDDLTQELDYVDTRVLLWRVEGALWTMGAFGGTIPSGMFHVRLPVASFGGTTEVRSQAPIVAVYGRGEFQIVGSGQYKLDYRSDDEIRERLGVIKPGIFPPWPTSSTALVSQAEIPQWLRTPPGGTNGYLLVETLNEAYGPTTIGDFKIEGAPYDGSQFAANVGTYVRALAGVSCGTKFDGEPTGGGTSTLWPDANKALSIWKSKSWPSARSGATFAPSGEATYDLITVDYLNSNYLRTLMGPGTVAYDEVSFTTNAAQHVPGGYHQTSFWGPKRNAQWFVNSYPPAGTCGTASQLASSLALACVLSSGEIHTGDLSKPPIVDSLEKLGLFQRWLGAQGKLVRKNLSKMYLEDVPKRVVDAFVTKKPLDASAGEHGILLTKLQGQLSQGARIADSIASDLDQLSLAFDAANIQIQLANVDLSVEAKELAVRRVQAQARIASVLAQAASFTVVDAFGSKEYVEAADAVVQVGAELDVLSKLDDIEWLKKQKNTIQIAAALNELNTAASRLFGNVRENLSNFRTQAADLRAIVLELKSTENKAAYEAAKGSGADFLRSSSGKVLATYPVNTVLRRQYDATEQRYKRALTDAKRMAYLARLSIEQRFGMRLSSMTTPVGALEAPSKWVDSVCELSGVKYQDLRAADADAGAGSAADKKVIGEFADAFVGDYVAKLENFVEFYNLEFPSHEGDDVAVISLKNDLLGKEAMCTTEAANLLFHSGDLSGYHGISEGGVGITKGWVKTTCGATEPKCLERLPASALSGGSLSSPASVNPGEQLTWLRDVAPSTDAGVPVEAGVPASPDAAPKYAVWQRLQLAPGSYLLSFWDQARAGSGALVSPGDAGSTSPAYRVALLDSSYGVVAQQDIAPHEGDGWSERRVLRVNVKTLGDYEVVFWAAADPSKLGSVVIAGAQLEWSPSPVGEPTAYVATSSTRDVLSTECFDKAKDLVQKAFLRRCNAEGHCWYELVKPVWIDTVGLDAATSRLRGKLAAGNYNYRHVDIAVNLVGTGVRDCSRSPTSDCYGSGYVEYDLIHDAFQTSVLGWDGNTECFNFGSGVINHGKALAAERYITVPFGASDQSLVSQPSILKQEFRGRPLDGDYRLRIYDSPALAWDKLEDIQLVLKYRYWSAVRAKP